MTIFEKVAYLRGLCEGMKLDTEKNEGKLIVEIIDLLDSITTEISDLKENALDLSEEIDELSDDLAELEDVVFSDNDNDDDESPFCKCCGDDEDDEEPLFFDIKCPKCGEEITVDEEVLEQGSVSCPECDEKLEFDFNFRYNDDEDDED